MSSENDRDNPSDPEEGKKEKPTPPPSRILKQDRAKSIPLDPATKKRAKEAALRKRKSIKKVVKKEFRRSGKR